MKWRFLICVRQSYNVGFLSASEEKAKTLTLEKKALPLKRNVLLPNSLRDRSHICFWSIIFHDFLSQVSDSQKNYLHFQGGFIKFLKNLQTDIARVSKKDNRHHFLALIALLLLRIHWGVKMKCYMSFSQIFFLLYLHLLCCKIMSSLYLLAEVCSILFHWKYF